MCQGKGIEKMIKFLNYLSSFLLVLLLSSCSMSSSGECDDGYAVYREVFFDPLAKDKESMYLVFEAKKEDHRTKAAKVLNHYNMKNKLEDDQLLIDCNIWKDKDAMMNITSKANDDDWFQLKGLNKDN